MQLSPLLTCLLVSLLTWHASELGSSASDWSQFRGPSGLGVAQSNNLPEKFGLQENLIWKVSLPPGHSSPVLSQNRIFLTAYEDKKLLTIGLDRMTGGSGADRVVGAIRSGVRRADAAYAAMT